jgi:hypothetical protein
MPKPEVAQALLAHGHEQGQVVDIDEVTKRSDDDGRMQEVSP